MLLRRNFSIRFSHSSSRDHIQYDEHQCPSAYRKNIQVPTCPLCNQLVPYTHRDQSPDRAVSAHIDRDCKSDPALKKREKIYSNKCSVQSCKQREAIKVNCEKCTRSFCLRHRFPDDHQCQGFRPISRHAAAAVRTLHVERAAITGLFCCRPMMLRSH